MATKKSNKRAKNKYYTLLGTNAVLITPDRDYAKYCGKYFKEPHIRVTYTRREAEELANSHLWDIAPLDRAIPEHFDIGRIYFAAKLPRNC